MNVMMATNFDQQIRLHSWWHSAGIPKRTFAIVELRYDCADDFKSIWYTRVALLEYGYDEPKYYDYEDFQGLLERQAIIPMNTTPNMLPKNEKTPKP